MALRKQIELQDGNYAEYHRITATHRADDPSGARLLASYSLYKSASAASSGKRPCLSGVLDLGDFGQFVAAGGSFSAAYEIAKAGPLAGAEDC